jgi:hypothetical protein
VPGKPTFHFGDKEIAETDIGESSADHHLVISPPGSIAIEFLGTYPVFDEVPSGRAVRRDRTCRGNVIRGHRIPKEDKYPGTPDWLYRLRLQRETFEERCLADVGAFGIPGKERYFRSLEVLPLGRLGRPSEGDLEGLGTNTLAKNRRDFFLSRPNVPEINGLTGGVKAEGLGVEVDIDSAGKGIGYHKRRAGQIVGFH